MDVSTTTFPSLPGTYAIVFNCLSPFDVSVGRLGQFTFPTGYWIYVGSAFGPGGLRSRLNHHLRPSVRPHWHVDTIKTEMLPVEIWTTVDPRKREHEWAKTVTLLKGASCPVRNFGSTDCSCRSHLAHIPKKPPFQRFQSHIHRSDSSHAPLRKTVLSDNR